MQEASDVDWVSSPLETREHIRKIENEVRHLLIVSIYSENAANETSLPEDDEERRGGKGAPSKDEGPAVAPRTGLSTIDYQQRKLTMMKGL
jgi:hypothetical protein